MAHIISVINDKGGVGKTTTVASLGTALWLLGKHVLLVDTDAQRNLTTVLDMTSVNTDENIATWLMGPLDATPPVYERYEGLDYIPSYPEGVNLENYLREKAGGDRYLAMRLATIQHYYDYIIIDCSPGSTSLINTNALESCNNVIIPTKTDIFGVTGRSMLLNRIDEIRLLGVNINIIGALFTQYDRRSEMGRMVKDYFKQEPDIPLLPVTIRRSEDINKAAAVQQTIFEYNPSSPAADEYMMLAERISALLEKGTEPAPRRKAWTPEAWGKKAQAAFTTFIKHQQENTEDK